MIERWEWRKADDREVGIERWEWRKGGSVCCWEKGEIRELTTKM